MNINPKKILIIEPHPDDAIIGAGGTIARLHRENPNVSIWDTYICPCTEDPRNEGNLDEHSESCKILGIEKIVANYFPRNGYIENNSQKVRDILYSLKKEYVPDLVISPSYYDAHNDHSALGNMVLTVFRDSTTIIQYEVLSSSLFQPNFYVTLNEDDVNKKIDSLKCWKSQYIARPSFFNNEKFLAQLLFRGTQVREKYAEGFYLLWGKI